MNDTLLLAPASAVAGPGASVASPSLVAPVAPLSTLLGPGDAGPGAVLAHGGELGPPSAATLFALRPDSWLALVLLAAAALYCYAWWLLRARGHRWPVGRGIAFLGPGLGGIAAVTLTGVGAYDTTLLSVHMIQHMVLSMVAPIFLALGAPVTLALRVLPKRPRDALSAALHSRVARVLAHPLVAYALFVFTPFTLYFSGLYELTVRNVLVHELVHAHFILVGCLFFWPLIGVDPLPGRWPYPARALLMVLSTPFHAVLGLTIMQSTTLLGGDWYPSLGLAWTDPFEDQELAGGILWAGGEAVSITMLAVLVGQWMKASDREARRVDRQLDREELVASLGDKSTVAEERARAERANGTIPAG